MNAFGTPNSLTASGAIPEWLNTRSRPESYTMKGEIEPMIKPVIEPNFWFNPNV